MAQLSYRSCVYLQVPNLKNMLKNIASLLLLLFVFAFGHNSFAFTEPENLVKTIPESDSTAVKSKQLLNSSQEKPKVTSSAKSTETKLAFWETNEEVEEDSTSNSALSFNFIYYIIEKFKFQVE